MNKSLIVVIAVAALLGFAATGFSQPPPGGGLEQDEAARTAELEAARAQLASARAELERAARELARLSAERLGPLADTLRMNGNFVRFARPMLGLNISNDEDGVRVVGVSPGGPGAAAGIEIGDLIVAIGDVEVDGSTGGNSTQAFLGALGDVEPGGEVELSLLRDGAPLTLSVQTREWNPQEWVANVGDRVNLIVRDIPNVAERSIVRVMEQPFLFGAWSDMELVELTPELGRYFGTEEGLLVVRAPQADDIDLRDGDVILEISGRTPQSVGHAMRILRSFEPQEPLELTIVREQRRRTITIVTPGSDPTTDAD